MKNAALAPWLQRQLQELLKQPAHALLLQGPSGLGQLDLALALARAWLCEEPQQQGACGHCSSCHAFAVHTHADLCVLMPESQMLACNWPLPEKSQAEIDGKKRKPSREIRVDAMRAAIGFMQSSSARGRGKVVLIYPAERMNPVAANALLKTLEEPAAGKRFILACESLEQLLPTIISRCQHHVMRWPQEHEAAAWLQDQGMRDGDAEVFLRLAGGRPELALELAADARAMTWWSGLPQALKEGRVDILQGLELPQAVDCLQKLCHDVMLVKTGSKPRFFDRADLPLQSPPWRHLLAWWKILQHTARMREHPLNARLALEYLASTAQRALSEKN